MNDIASVQKRPGMYVGSTDDGTGLHNMLFSVLCEAAAECLAGQADLISVTLNQDGSCTVSENGRGIVCATDYRGQTHGPEVVLTRYFVPDAARSGKSLGAPAVGLCPVNALSDWFEVRHWRNGREWFFRFVEGWLVEPSQAPSVAPRVNGEYRHGSEITFRPNPNIFSDLEFDIATIDAWIRSVTSRHPQVVIEVHDQRSL
jgi:DNA gyrase subunit B